MEADGSPSDRVEHSELDCGIQLVTEAMPGVRSACVGFWVGTGSRDEGEGEAGISHFLEHLLFKGTVERSARAIAEEADAAGADMNAYTTKEYTTFYMRTLGSDLDLALDILSDIFWKPALRPEEVDAERQVILEEVLMHRDEPADVVHERFAEALFPDHPLGREVLGLPEVITTVTVPTIREFLEAQYRPGNVVVAAAGEVDHARLAAGIEARYAGRPVGAPPIRTAPGEETRPLDVTWRATEQAHLVLGVRALERRSERRFACSLLNHVLGGGMSSRLFQKIREERGLAYSVGSDRTAFADAGALAISVGTAPERVPEVLDLVHAELDDLAANGITAHELDVAKRHVKADTVLSLEDSGARMSRIGSSQLLYDEVLPVDELVARIEAVEVAEVAELAGELFGGERVLAAVGPFDASDLVRED